MTPLSQIREDFALLDDWEDRYRYVIELGRTLPPMPEVLKTEANRVRGCASQVWLATHVETKDGEPLLTFKADSDAHIVRGLIAIVLAVYGGKRASEIIETDANPIFAELGLKEHLTQQRANGLASMIERVRADATDAAERHAVS